MDVPIEDANGLDDNEFGELLCTHLNTFVNKDLDDTLPNTFVDSVNALSEIYDVYLDSVVEEFPRTEFVRFSRDIVRML